MEGLEIKSGQFSENASRITSKKCYSCGEARPVEFIDIEYTAYSRIGRNRSYLGDVPILCDDCTGWLLGWTGRD